VVAPAQEAAGKAATQQAPGEEPVATAAAPVRRAAGRQQCEMHQRRNRGQPRQHQHGSGEEQGLSQEAATDGTSRRRAEGGGEKEAAAGEAAGGQQDVHGKEAAAGPTHYNNSTNGIYVNRSLDANAKSSMTLQLPTQEQTRRSPRLS
ncbi:hypothetical protein CYMTET_28730, partial [Cymbomonas tetramitiformis]